MPHAYTWLCTRFIFYGLYHVSWNLGLFMHVYTHGLNFIVYIMPHTICLHGYQQGLYFIVYIMPYAHNGYSIENVYVLRQIGLT